ncbi:MAG: EVE domain-containing protein [Deltaproteobacteria bacterium]|nr:EVE domain-containing protein [Deltaproteobacteria bacterium]
MKYWLIKTEPGSYSWEQFVRDQRTFWNGVRNYQARINLRAMAVGDLCLFYHSVSDKAVMGLARVVREAYPDHTADDGEWVMVDVEPVRALGLPVTIDMVKARPDLADMVLVKNSRLSVQPVTKAQFDAVVKMGGKAK